MNWQSNSLAKKRWAIVAVLAVMLMVAAYSANVALADGLKWAGAVESIPAGGGAGNWQVGGRTFVADSNTDFDDDGPLSLGECAEVEYLDTGSVLQALKIERADSGSCGGSGTETPEPSETPDASPTPDDDSTPEPTNTPEPGDDDDDQDQDDELYGVVQEIPAGGLGIWKIGDWLFNVDANTEIDDDDAPIAVGVMVKVEFTTDSAGNHYAKEIDVKSGDDDDDDGNDDDKSGWDDEGHAYGVIDGLPNGLIGTWQIGGLDYEVMANTELDDDDGPFVAGARVKVEYKLLSDGKRLAKEIETTSDDGDVSQDDHAKMVGYVKSMPSSSLYGPWDISGVMFVAAPGAKFEEDHGAFAVGAYVEVEYVILPNGDKSIVKIKTDVPPGAGDDDVVGKIDEINDDNSAAAAVMAASSLKINGQIIALTPATKVDDSQGKIIQGATVFVNTYVGAAGVRTATLVRSLDFGPQVYLPFAVR